MIRNIILYARLSNEDTNLNDIKVESNSITNQRDLLQGYVKSKEEFKNANIIFKSDSGFSGANLERPAIKEVLEMVEKREVDCIIVKDLSRFLRNDLETIYYLDEVFPLYGVRIISIGDKFDSDDNIGKTSNIDIIFRSIAYRMYIEDLSKKVKQGKKQKIMKGEYISGLAPIGYKKSTEIKNKLVIEEEGAEIIRYMFSLALKGMSTVDIAYKFNAENIPTCSQLRSKLMNKERNWNRANKNNKWSSSKISTMLQNEVYLGNILYCKYVPISIGDKKVMKNSPENILRYENAHEPIISKEDFEIIQNKIINRPKKQKPIYNIYLYSKKLKCKNCNRQLKKYESSIKGTYYNCPTKLQDKSCICLSENILENDISKQVIKAIKGKIVVNDIKVDEITPKLDEFKSNIAKCEKNILNKESTLNKIKEKGMILYDNYKEKLLKKEEFLIRKGELNSKKINIQEEIENLNQNLDSLKNEYELLQKDKAKNSIYTIIDETLTRELVEKYIDCIYVNTDLSLEIVFNETI